MKASDAIDKLDNLIEKYGDLDLKDTDGLFDVDDIVYMTDGEEEIFVFV